MLHREWWGAEHDTDDRFLMNTQSCTYTSTNHNDSSNDNNDYTASSISLPSRSTPRRDGASTTRPVLSREIGSATISLRPRAVSSLSDEEDEEQITSKSRSNPKPSIPLSSSDHAESSSSHLRRGKSPPFGTSPSRSLRRNGGEFRPRAKSLISQANPLSPNEIKSNFYLSHYSTDTQYSLERVEDEPVPLSVKGDGKHKRVIELGLGDELDLSFGEALRRGVEGEEISLPKEALRVLNEAKENLEIRGVVKQGRKGSIGMGLFKESRVVSLGDKKKVKKDKEEVVMEEKEEEEVRSSGWKTRSRSTTSGTVVPTSPRPGQYSERRINEDTPSMTSPMPIRSLRKTTTTSQEFEQGEMSAGMRLVSSPPLRQGLSSNTRSDSGEGDPLPEDESAWTTSSGTSSSSSEQSDSQEEAQGDDVELEDTEVDESDEEDRMTVPLQPFNHAVGGHSSIYKFTRRAVCKVGDSRFSKLV